MKNHEFKASELNIKRVKKAKKKSDEKNKNRADFAVKK